MGKSKNGFALGTVLMIITLGMLLAFAVAGVSVQHLRVAARLQSVQAAHNLAESALADAIHQVTQKLTYGQGHETLPLAPSSDATAIVTFDEATAAREHMLCSYNNLAPNPSATPPPPVAWPTPPVPTGIDVHQVPSGAVLVASKALVDGIEKRGLAIIDFPLFPYAIGSNGPVHSSGPLLVAASAPGTPQNALSNATGRGNIASNSIDTRALLLGTGAKVTGDAEAVGGVVLEPLAIVQGSVEAHSNTVGLPKIDIPQLDPAAQGMPGISPVFNNVTDPTLNGFNRCQGNLIVTGNLNLDQGVVYVSGNLQVSGGITGHGVVIVDGSTSVGQGGDMQSNGLAALVSRGDVSLNGQDSSTSAFSGLVYTQGSFSARNITLVGAFVGADPTGGSTLDLHSANVIHVPSYSKISVNASTSSSSYGSPQFPAYIGPNSIPINWKEYSDRGQPVYVLTDAPNQRPLPQPQFWDFLAQFLISKGMPASKFPPGWQHTVTLQDMSMSGHPWLPVQHFLDYLTPQGSPPSANIIPGITTTRNGTYEFDMNKFIDPADQVRVLLWEVY